MMNAENKISSNFFKVPNTIFAVGLSSKAIVVYCCLMRHAGEKLKCFPSRKTIANECSIGVHTVDGDGVNLSECAAGYMRKIGLTEQEITAIKNNLSEDYGGIE